MVVAVLQIIVALIVAGVSWKLAQQANQIAESQAKIAEQSYALAERQLAPRFRFRAAHGLDPDGQPYEIIEIYNDGGSIAGFTLWTFDFVNMTPKPPSEDEAPAQETRWASVHYFHPVVSGQSDGLVGGLTAYDPPPADMWRGGHEANHTLHAALLGLQLPKYDGSLVNFVELTFEAWDGARTEMYRLERVPLGEWRSFATTAVRVTEVSVDEVRMRVSPLGDQAFGSFTLEGLEAAAGHSTFIRPPGTYQGMRIEWDAYTRWSQSTAPGKESELVQLQEVR